MDNFKDYITITKAAKMLGVTPMTLRRWHKKEKLIPHCEPFSKYRFYKKSELKKILKKLAKSNK